MAKTIASQSKNLLKVSSIVKSKLDKQVPVQPAEQVIINPKTIINSTINSSFQNDNTARVAITKNLKERSVRSIEFTERAKNVFSKFDSSRFSISERRPPNYLKPDGNLLDKQIEVIVKEIASRMKSVPNHSLTLANTDELEKFIIEVPTDSGGVIRTLNLDNLLAHINLKSRGRHFKAKDSIITDCEAELEAERRLKNILEATDPAHKDSSGSSIADRTTSQDSGDSVKLDPDALDLVSASLVKKYVDLQMETSTSPESQVRYDRSKQMDEISKNIDTFELRSGPSDVTSYHDFHNLQIAFENVWTEIFDERLGSLGQQLYEEYVKLKDFSGVDDGVDPTISTIDDLRQLMGEIKSFTQQTAQNLSPAVNSTIPGTNNNTNNSLGNSALGAGFGLAAGPLLGLDPITAAAFGFIGGKLGWW